MGQTLLCAGYVCRGAPGKGNKSAGSKDQAWISSLSDLSCDSILQEHGSSSCSLRAFLHEGHDHDGLSIVKSNLYSSQFFWR